MDRLRRRSAEQPLSISETTKRAEDFDYNPLIPLRYWLRTAGTLLKEAHIYELEGNDQQAFLLLFRHAKLVLEYLSKHPDARIRENRSALDTIERELPRVLARLEILKPRITHRYEQHQRLIHEQQIPSLASAGSKSYLNTRRAARASESATLATPSDQGIAQVALPLAAGENRDFAVQLAHKEIRRRETARRATRQASVSWAEEQSRRNWGEWENALAKNNGRPQTSQIREDGLQAQLQETRQLIDRQQGSVGPLGSAHWLNGAPRPSGPNDQTLGFQYPTVPKRDQRTYQDRVPTPQPLSATLRSPARGILKSPPRPPDVPEKPTLTDDGANRLETTPRSSSTSNSIADDAEPSDFTFKPSAYLENGSSLRTLFLPPDLRASFLDMASSNTRQNLETCGILCGTLISNAFFVSRLIIPEQKSTSDTCETVDEGALFDYCDAEDLMVLGWIHTHPTQMCFMSSRDLHTHSGYQVMLPESIAIVCAPSSTPSWGIFRLTDPPGLKTILHCSEPGLFHPHSQSHIYTDALRPGHVFEAKGLQFEIADLRRSASK